MSNERIDLTEFEDLQHSWRTRSGIYDELFSQWIGDRKEEIMAELKRCYEELDFLKANVLNDDDELWWIATCKPDGEGQCTMEIEGYEELMRLVKEGKVEIPEYSHGFDELLLQEGCECGVTHDEWLEGKN